MNDYKMIVVYPDNEYYLAIKRDESLINTMAWINLEIMLSMIRQTEKRSTFCIVPFIQNSRREN